VIQIRTFQPGDELPLLAVFRSSVRQIAAADYTPEQLNAWAPEKLDREVWKNRITANRPFVAELDGRIVGFADVQPTGSVDTFFVAGDAPRRGIGRALMERIFLEAAEQGIVELTSHVSLTAQPFFAKFGFEVVEHRLRELRGQVLPYALMRRNVAGTVPVP